MPTCLSGHESPAYAQFCTTCGQPVHDGASAESTPLLAAPQGPPAAAAPPIGPPAAALPTVALPTVARPVAGPMTPPAYAPPPGPSAMAPPPGYGPAAPPAPPFGHGPPAAQRPPAAAVGYPLAAAPGSGPRYQFQLRRLTLIDRVTGAGALVLFITLWFPWFGYSSGGFDVSIGGINAHSYLSFVVLTSVVLISYLGARAGWDRLPVHLPIAHAPLLLVVGVVQLVIVLIAFLSTPNGLSHSAGSWIGLTAALAASLPIVIPAIQASQRR